MRPWSHDTVGTPISAGEGAGPCHQNQGGQPGVSGHGIGKVMSAFTSSRQRAARWWSCQTWDFVGNLKAFIKNLGPYREGRPVSAPLCGALTVASLVALLQRALFSCEVQELLRLVGFKRPLWASLGSEMPFVAEVRFRCS